VFPEKVDGRRNNIYLGLRLGLHILSNHPAGLAPGSG
jgi:hypothetical protein